MRHTGGSLGCFRAGLVGLGLELSDEPVRVALGGPFADESSLSITEDFTGIDGDNIERLR
jgi:hypothetical protein